MRKLLFGAALSSILFVFACGETAQDAKVNENTDAKVDSTEQAVPAKTKTREELIINRNEMSFADPANPTDFEYKHTPEITIGETGDDGLTEVLVKVGSNGIVHPSGEDHWIDFMTLYLDGKEVEKKEQPNDENSNKAVFKVNMDGAKTVKVTLGCNLHGIWSNEITVK